MAGGAGRIRIGVGGWVFEPWRGAFYPDGLPQKRELEYAASKLSSIEINGTYYGSQKPESFARWHDGDARRFRLRAEGLALHHQSPRAGRGRALDREVPRRAA